MPKYQVFPDDKTTTESAQATNLKPLETVTPQSELAVATTPMPVTTSVAASAEESAGKTAESVQQPKPSLFKIFRKGNAADKGSSAQLAPKTLSPVVNQSVVVTIPPQSPIILSAPPPDKEEAFWYFKDDLLPSPRARRYSAEVEQDQKQLPHHPNAFFGLGNGLGLGAFFSSPSSTKKVDPEPMNDPQAAKVPFNNLEEEIKLFLPRVFVVRMLDRFVLFQKEEEANMFKEIRKYQKKNASSSKSEAFETFGSKRHGDALLRIAYNEHMDQFMSYRNFDYFGKNLEKYRYQFFEKMVQQDLILILDVSDTYSDRRREICICCPFERLIQEAHDIKLYMPLTKAQISVHIKQFEQRIKPPNKRFMKISNTYRYTTQCQAKRSTIFDKNRMSDFVGGSEPPETLCQDFFSPMKRTYLIQSIINKISITRDSIFSSQARSSEKAEPNASDLLKTWFISDLLSKTLITRWMPLHGKQLQGLRIRYKSFLKSIGPTTVRNYFGEEVGFYFGWVQFYTEWCIVICIPGLAAVGWGFAVSGVSVSKLSLSDSLSLFDNSNTILFGFTLNLCSIMFVKFWKRRNHLLQFLWDVGVTDASEVGQEEVRIGWVPSKKLAYSPINGEMIPYEAESSQITRRILSFVGVLSCIVGLALVIAANIGLQSYSENVGPFGIGFLDQFGTTGDSAFASVVSAVVIVLLSFIFDRIVLRLIQFENHRSLEKHLNHYIWVQFLLQFLNSYGLLLFTAIMRPIFHQISPGISYLFGPLSCTNQGFGDTCMKSLVLSVSITFIIQNFIFQLIGWIQLVYHNSKMKILESKTKSNYQLDKRMDEVTSESFEQVYNSRIVQFGYLVLFSSAFPFGPFLALVNNFFEANLNGNQYLYSYSRPFVVRSKGIGSWQTISSSLVILGIVVNGLSLPYISDGFYDATQMLYQMGILESSSYRYHQVLFVVVYEHLLLICYILAEMLIPDVPECVRVGRLAEIHILKERMKPNHEETEDTGAILKNEKKSPSAVEKFEF